MAIIYQTTDLIGAGTQITTDVSDYSGLFVNTNVLVASTSGSATVISDGSYQAIQVLGTLSGTGTAIELNGFGATVTIEAGGLITANNSYYTAGAAIKSFGYDAVIKNYGHISGGNAVKLMGSNSKLFNYGDIDGTEQNGIYNNLTAVQLGSSIEFDGYATYVENHGTITGMYFSILSSPIPFETSYETMDNVVNFGTLSGSVSLNTREDSVLNSGLIIGDVILGADADVYEGLQDGTVTGTIYGDGGNDTLKGASGSDTIDGGSDDDLIRGRDGDDDLSGGTGFDVVYGGRGDDTIDGGGFDANKLYGGRGNDTITTGAGGDIAYGGSGEDSLTGNVGVDTLYGGADDDYLSGAGGSDTLYGNSGDDIIFGGLARDYMHGGNGDDTLTGGAGSDRLYGGQGDDVMTGGAGDDRFIFAQKSGFDIITDFTDGADKMNFRAFGTGIGAVAGAASSVDGDTVIDMSGITGEAGALLVLEGFDITDLSAGDFLF